MGVIVYIALQIVAPMQAQIDSLSCEIEASYNRTLSADQANLAESARDVANRYVTLSEFEPLSQSNQLRLEQKRLQEQQFLAEETRLLGLAEAACDG